MPYTDTELYSILKQIINITYQAKANITFTVKTILDEQKYFLQVKIGRRLDFRHEKTYIQYHADKHNYQFRATFLPTIKAILLLIIELFLINLSLSTDHCTAIVSHFLKSFSSVVLEKTEYGVFLLKHKVDQTKTQQVFPLYPPVQEMFDQYFGVIFFKRNYLLILHALKVSVLQTCQ